MVKGIRFALVGVLLLFAAAAHAQERIARVVHTPVAFADAGQPIDISAYLEGDVSPSMVVEAQIRFRNRDQDSYDYVDMVSQGTDFVGQIPGEFVSAVGMLYYLEFDLEDGTRLTFPESDPGSDYIEPIEVSVREAGAAEPQSPVVVITPEPLSTVSGDEILIAVAFNQAVHPTDPTRVRLRVNSVDHTAEATITEEVLTAVVGGFAKGRHRIDLILLTDEGPEILKTWFFNWQPEEEARRAANRYITGSADLEGMSQRTNAFTENIARESFSFRGRYGILSATARARLTSQEQGHLQPQHRYLFTLGVPKVRLRIGDINPRYNDLILYGRRVRGTELDINPGPVRIQLLYGNLSRAVEGRESIAFDPTSGAPVDTTLYPGTFRRWLAATRVSFGVPNRLMLGITAMKAKDDTSSIEFGDRSKDNLVTGFDIEANFDRRRLTFYAQTALSLYNDNTLVAPLEDAEAFKDIIWINQYFQPLPTSGIDTSAVDFGEVIGSIIDNALSYKAKLRLRYFSNDIQLAYQKINRSFITMGNPTLVNDWAGFSIKDRIRLFGSRVYFTAQYDSYNDNVNGRGDITTTRDSYNFKVSAYPAGVYPDITIGYGNLTNSNDGTIDSYEAVPGDPASVTTIDNRVKNSTAKYSVQLAKDIPFSTTQNRFSLSFSASNREDTFDALGTSDYKFIALTDETKYEFPLKTLAGFTNTSQTSIGGQTDLSWNTIFVRGEYALYNRRLIPYFGPRITLGSGKQVQSLVDPGLLLDPNDYATPEEYQQALSDTRASSIHLQNVDFSRIDWIGGAQFDFLKRHSLTAYFSLTMYSEKGTYEYWNGNTFPVDEELINNAGVTLTQPKYQKRNDYFFSITYSVKF